jgi:hypothetical protein
MIRKGIIILPFAAIATLFLWPFRESFVGDRCAEW